MATVLIKNGRIVTAVDDYRADILVQDGRVHTIGKDIGMVYLPLDLAQPGSQVEIEVFGQRIRAQVVSTPLVDPKGERLRA